MIETFEKYLEDIFIQKGELGGIPIVKDNCEDLFENWLGKLDASELIELGNDYGRYEYLKGVDVNKK